MKTSYGEKRLRIRLKNVAASWKHEVDLLRAQKKISVGSDEVLIRGKIVALTDARIKLMEVLRDPCP